MLQRRVLAFVLVACVASGFDVSAPSPGLGLQPRWRRPVPGRVVREFRPPRTRFGRGHLGVDFTAAPGTPVGTVGAGRVEFAGDVGRAKYVVVRHPGGLRTSYAFLATIRVRKGQPLRAGAIVGTSGGRGENHESGVFHLGLRRGTAFVDPMQLFAAPGLALRVHLAPDPGPDRPGRRPLEWGGFRTDSGGMYRLFARP